MQLQRRLRRRTVRASSRREGRWAAGRIWACLRREGLLGRRQQERLRERPPPSQGRPRGRRAWSVLARHWLRPWEDCHRARQLDRRRGPLRLERH